MDRNRVIGRANALPWRLPEDLKFFKRSTMGKPIIMGRNTYESIGRPLPGRTNIVLTRSGFTAAGVRSAIDLDSALEIAAAQCEIDRVEECFVIGGAEAYAQSLGRADRLYCTLVDADVDGDTFFPEVSWSDWDVIEQHDHEADDTHEFGFSIRILGHRGDS